MRSTSCQRGHVRSCGRRTPCRIRVVTTAPHAARRTIRGMYSCAYRRCNQPAAKVTSARATAPAPKRFRTWSARSPLGRTRASTSPPRPIHPSAVSAASATCAAQSAKLIEDYSNDLRGIERCADEHPHDGNEIPTHDLRRFVEYGDVLRVRETRRVDVPQLQGGRHEGRA